MCAPGKSMFQQSPLDAPECFICRNRAASETLTCGHCICSHCRVSVGLTLATSVLKTREYPYDGKVMIFGKLEHLPGKLGLYSGAAGVIFFQEHPWRIKCPFCRQLADVMRACHPSDYFERIEAFLPFMDRHPMFSEEVNENEAAEHQRRRDLFVPRPFLQQLNALNSADARRQRDLFVPAVLQQLNSLNSLD